MQRLELKAQPRAEEGRNKVKHLRRKGIVPGVVYGAHRKPQAIQLDAQEITNVIHKAHSEHVLVQLTLEDRGRLALLQGVQHEPISREILHVDFQELREDEKFTVSVALQAIGEPEGVRLSGGVLEYVMRELRVRCLPKDLPDRITVDVTALTIGQSIHVSDLKVPEGVELLEDKGSPVIAVVAPNVEEEPAPGEAAAELTEPEVIREKKAEEGEAEGKPGEKPAAKGEAKGETKGKAEAKPEGKGEGKPEAKKK